MKRNSVAALLLAMLFVFLSLTGCTAPSSFTVLAESIPENLDPQLARTAAEKTAVVNLFEGLYRRDGDGNAVLAAAKSVEVSDDGLIWTFALHEDRVWDTYRRDGEQVTPAVTADDFLFAFQRIFNKHTASPWAAGLMNIENAAGVLAGTLPADALGVEAQGDHTLVIRLSRPDAALPQKLTGAGAMPCNREFFAYAAGAYGLSYSYLLTNGPFAIYAWQSGDRLTLARDEDVRGWVNTVTFSAPEGDDSRGFAERFAAGEGSGAMASAGNGQGGAYSLTTWAILFDCGNSFLDDTNVRAALASVALGSEPDLTAPAHSHLQPAGGLVPPGVSAGEMSYREAAGRPYTLLQNPGGVMRQAVNRWAEETGGDGFATAPALTVLVPDSGPYAELFDEINERWQRQLSCFFSVERLGREELEAAVKAGGYDIALAPLYAESDSAADMLAAFSQSAGTGWNSSEFTALLARAQAETNGDAALQYAIQAESLLLAQWPLAPVFYETNSFVTDKDYGGLSVYPFGPVLDFSAPDTGGPGT